MAALSPASKAAIARLRAFTAPATNYYNLPLTRRAAVLILLFADRKGELRVVLTIRSAKLKNYAGQAALPGGKADTLHETPWETARREAFEEIGLPMTDDKLPAGYSVEHLAELPANLAMTELGVRPCVAWLKHRRQEQEQSKPNPQPSASRNSEAGVEAGADAEAAGAGAGAAEEPHPNPSLDLPPTLNPKEVAAVLTAPFHNFLTAQDEHPRDRDVPGTWYHGTWHSWHEEPWRMHQFFVPTVREGSVFRSSDGEDVEGLDARGAACSPLSGTPVLLADQKEGERKDQGKSAGFPERGYKNGGDEDALAQPRYRVFGMTARILVDAARVAYGVEPAFEHNSHFGDEDMIERLMRIGRLGAEKKQGEVLTRDVMMKAKREGAAKLS